MKKALILLAVLATMSFALIDVHFGNIQCDTLQVDSLSTIVAADLTTLSVDTLTVDTLATIAAAGIEDLTVDSTCTINSVATFGDTVHIGSIMEFDNSTFTIYDSAIDAIVQFTAATNGVEFYADVVCDSQLTVGDTLAVGLSTPEYFFHVSNAGDYSLFEGDATGVTYVAVDNNHATAESGFSIWRQGVPKWGVEDSNGSFIIWDVDDSQNAITISDSTCTVTIAKNLGVSGDASFADSVYVGGNALFASAPNLGGATDTLICGSDTVEVINGVITSVW